MDQDYSQNRIVAFVSKWFHSGPIFFSAFINIIVWILLVSKFGFSSELGPLHFNIVYGIDLVDREYFVYQLPIFGILVILLNRYFAKIYRGKQSFFADLLDWSALFVQMLLLLATIALLRQV